MGTDVQTISKQKSRWRWINPALRIGAAVQVVLVVLQATLAGLSLTGSREALVWHESIGTEWVTLVGLIVLLLAVMTGGPGEERRGRRSWRWSRCWRCSCRSLPALSACSVCTSPRAC